MTDHDLAVLVEKEFAPLKITVSAWEKAHYLSRRVCELGEQPLELSFFLLGQSDLVIRDIYLGHDQRVTSTFCKIPLSGVIASALDVQTNYDLQIIGWGHSHGCWDNFYSPTDETTLAEREKLWGVFKNLDFQNNKPKESELAAGQDYYNLPLSQGTLSLINAEEKQRHKAKFVKGQMSQILLGVFYGMTFNAKGDDPYCVIAYSHSGQETCLLKKQKYVIVAENKPCRWDKDDLDAQLIKRVNNLNFLNHLNYLESD